MTFYTHSQLNQDNVFQHPKVSNNLSNPLPTRTNYINEDNLIIPCFNVQVADTPTRKSNHLARDDSWVESPRPLECLTSSFSYNDLRADCPFNNPPIRSHSDNHIFPCPPVPPRDYPPHNNERKNKVEIHPVLQDGIQKSNTHYWLLPEKQNLTDTQIHELEEYENLAKKSTATKTVNKQDMHMHAAKVTNNKPDLTCGLSGLIKLDRRASDRQPLIFDTDDDSVNFSFDNLANERLGKCEENLCEIPFRNSKPVKGASESSGMGNPTPKYNVTTLSDDASKSMSDVQPMIEAVMLLVSGTTFEESQTALSINQWSVQSAVKYLRVETLFRLGLATRDQCWNVLQLNDWEVEAAADELVRGR